MRALVLAFAVLGSAPATAQEGPWLLRADIGGVDFHDSLDRGLSGSLRVGRAWGETRVFSLDVGLNAANADGGFGAGVLGLEARAWPHRTVSLFVRVEGGLLLEEEGGYPLLGAGIGVAVRLNPKLSLRASAMLAEHGFGEGGGGPTVFQVGIEYRF